jgi:hypothetical protein
METKAELHCVNRKWFCTFIINGGKFQALEEYEGDEGLVFWKDRLQRANIPYWVFK